MRELFQWLKPWLDVRINRERKKGNTHKRGVTYKEFIEIINDYLDLSFTYIIESGRGYEIGHKFGETRVVKTECVVYNPRKYYVKTEGGKKVKHVEKYRDVVLGDGTIAFMIWKQGSKKKRYRLRMSARWKQKIWEHVQSGQDYMDYTMDKRSAQRAAIIYARTHGRKS